MPLIDRFISILMTTVAAARATTRTQWALRCIGLISACLAPLIPLTASPQASMPGPYTKALIAAIWLCALAQSLRADSSVATIGFLLTVLALWVSPEQSVAAALMCAALLGTAHSAWALAARSPAHAPLARDASRLSARALASVLGLSVVGVLIVLALTRIPYGTIPGFMILVASVVIIGTAIMLIPREDTQRREFLSPPHP